MKCYPFLLLCLCLGCGPETTSTPENTAVELRPIPLETQSGMAPNLVVDDEGTVYLSWIEFVNDTTDALWFSRMEEDHWSVPQEIARGDDWFANWADFPALAVFPGSKGRLAAHWLQKSAGGTYDYDIRVSVSDTLGENWSPSFLLNQDGIPAEHGFVSLEPIGQDRLLACWLDGRNTKIGTGDSAEGHGHGTGAMTLRAAEFDTNGSIYSEAELDARVCDCCQTGLAISQKGPVVVYRDRSESEIRDIALVRWSDSTWSEPVIPAADQWHTTACPVNGPAIATSGHGMAIAWFSAAEEEPKVRLLLSEDDGESFGPPILVSANNPLGRVDIQWIDDRSGIVIWVEQTGSEEAFVFFRLWTVDGQLSPSTKLVSVSPARASGFPRLAVSGEQVILAVTETEPDSRVQTYELMGISSFLE